MINDNQSMKVCSLPWSTENLLLSEKDNHEHLAHEHMKWNSWKYGRKNFERHSGWGWVLQGCFHPLEEYHLDILRSKALLPDFLLRGRVMFYFGLDLLSWSKLAWLGKLYTYRYVLREPQWPWLTKCWTIEGDLQNTNLFDAITASTKC